jgi:hypothetical protein
MKDVDELQQQCDVLLDRFRDLDDQLHMLGAVAIFAFLLAVGVPTYFAVGLTLAGFAIGYIIRRRRERKIDKVLDQCRVRKEDFEDYAEAEKELARFLAELK